MSAIESSNANAINSAVGWLQSALIGTVATIVAITAIASVGFLMLAGRIDVRRAAQVVFGCFIIFGAATIANGILSAISRGDNSPDLAQTASPPQPLPGPPATAHVNSTPYNPYASPAYFPPH